ncbi:MAG: flavin reductase [Sphingomonadales bacterium]|nr:flavin reductase [Sphingomonadales bacterium]
MPAPVGIVTTLDPAGHPVGLAMSALMPVSLEPPAMAICVNRSAGAHQALVGAGLFCINLLHSALDGHILPFADPAARELRFTQADWQQHGESGIWYIAGAAANLFCETAELLAHGTHDLIVGNVVDLLSGGGEDIIGWGNGAPGRLQPLPGKSSA